VGAVDASDDQRGRRGRFFDDYVNWGRISEYRRAALSGPLPRIAADLMGTRRPRFFHEHVLVKEPGGTASQTPWHQDDPYYGVDSDVNVSLWVPLDPVPDVVSLRILTGSHAHGRPRFVPHRFVDDVPYVSDDAPPPGYEHLADRASLWSDPRVAICPANPGDVVAFHFRTLHAPGTTSADRHHGGRRRVVSFRYLGDDARWATRPWKTSPPFADEGLVPGDVLDEGRFPIVDL
jgi:ectoine hydroxylase-related dioxygenase (phytanoyl-CoA dioxygenase family)